MKNTIMYVASVIILAGLLAGLYVYVIQKPEENPQDVPTLNTDSANDPSGEVKGNTATNTPYGTRNEQADSKSPQADAPKAQQPSAAKTLIMDGNGGVTDWRFEASSGVRSQLSADGGSDQLMLNGIAYDLGPMRMDGTPGCGYGDTPVEKEVCDQYTFSKEDLTTDVSLRFSYVNMKIKEISFFNKQTMNQLTLKKVDATKITGGWQVTFETFTNAEVEAWKTAVLKHSNF